MDSFAKRFVGSLLIIAALSVAACNTVEGVGEDIQGAAEETEEAMD